MVGIIELENMEFHAFHGCFEEEKIIGNTFIVNLKVRTDVEKAAVTDNIKDTLNYQGIYNIVKEQMKISSNLLENVCHRILEDIYAQFGTLVINVTITVSKCNPPLGGQLEKVSLTITR